MTKFSLPSREDNMRKQSIPIHLSESERDELDIIARTGQHKARIMRRAQILLWSDVGKTDCEIAGLLKITPATVAKTRQRWIENHQLEDAYRAGRSKKLDGKQEAFVVALACSDTPDGRECWTMQMLADKVVELGIVQDAVSDETIRRTLKKTS
jgi:transposase